MTLHDTFVQEFEAAFVLLTKGYAPQEIVGLGVHSDTDASGLVFAAHSRSDEQEQLAAYPDFPSDAIWSIGDWDIHLAQEESPSGPQSRVNDALDRAAADLDDDIHALRAFVWGSVVDAMATLHQRGFFDQWPESVRAFMVMDGSLDGHEVYSWHTRFNGEEKLSMLPTFLEIESDSL